MDGDGIKRESTAAEVDAAEAVLAESHGEKQDGYWRPTVEEMLRAAREAGEGS
jgi:hypothetical protein